MKTYYQADQALGTDIHMAIVTDAPEDRAKGLLKQFWLQIFLFEKRCSRFMLNSELSLFNRSAGIRQPITPEFRSVLIAAKQMGQVTGGLFNPFVLPDLQRAGYKRSQVKAFAHDTVDDYSGKQTAAVSALDIGDDWAAIPYGTAIDLGGCGKGFIGDELAEIAEAQEDLAGYWFSLGGDVVTGGLDEAGQPWTVYITPHIKNIDASERIGSATAPGGGRFAVATSTVSIRAGVENGKAWHHIINPQTRKPAETNITLATVCGASLLLADVAASCVIILGYPAARSFIERHTPAGALLRIDVSKKGSSRLETVPLGKAITAF